MLEMRAIRAMWWKPEQVVSFFLSIVLGKNGNKKEDFQNCLGYLLEQLERNL